MSDSGNSDIGFHTKPNPQTSGDLQKNKRAQIRNAQALVEAAARQVELARDWHRATESGLLADGTPITWGPIFIQRQVENIELSYKAISTAEASLAAVVSIPRTGRHDSSIKRDLSPFTHMVKDSDAAHAKLRNLRRVVDGFKEGLDSKTNPGDISDHDSQFAGDEDSEDSAVRSGRGASSDSQRRRTKSKIKPTTTTTNPTDKGKGTGSGTTSGPEDKGKSSSGVAGQGSRARRLNLGRTKPIGGQTANIAGTGTGVRPANAAGTSTAGQRVGCPGPYHEEFKIIRMGGGFARVLPERDPPLESERIWNRRSRRRSQRSRTPQSRSRRTRSGTRNDD